MKKFSSKRGYTLLFAVLTATLVLGVTVFILNVSRKQYILSATARDSIDALYAADSGIECAAMAKTVLAISSFPDDYSKPSIFSCNGLLVNKATSGQIPPFMNVDTYLVNPTPPGLVAPVYRSAPGLLTLGNDQCALIYITMDNATDPAGPKKVIIESRGYNLCNSTGPDTSSPRTVERALQISYTL